MALLDRVRKSAAAQPQTQQCTVLVCSVGADGADFQAEVAEDSAAYRRFFPRTTVQHFPNTTKLLQAIASGYTIVHVLAPVDTRGRIGESADGGAALIAEAAANGTKLLWIAASNAPDGYIAGFQPGRHRINVVMTIDRQGDALPRFIDDLFTRMQRGMKMPVAWNDIAPQIPGQLQPDTPEQIYAAGLAAATFF